jgi:uncharacterized protein YkwD
MVHVKRPMSASAALALVACISSMGCAEPEPDDANLEVGLSTAPLIGTTLFSDAFPGNFNAWPNRSSFGWAVVGSVASPASYALLPAGRSGTPVARVGTCGGTCMIQSPTFSLAGANAVSLEFSVSTTLSATTDYVGVRAFDGSTWSDVGAPWTRATGSTNWRRVTIDLTAYRGLDNFRFALYGRSLESADSAQFDDVQLIAAYATAACGDGVRSGNEACDGSDFGGETCVGLGFNGGVLSCTSSCTLDTNQCTDQAPGGVDCRNSATWPAAWVQFEDEVLVLVNQRRAAGASCASTAYPAVGAVIANDKLRQASRCHSLDMATQDYFSHTGLDGSNPGARIAAAGYRATTWGENIAAGYTTPQQVMDGWMASEGHCINIMNRNFQQLGVGYGFDIAASYDHYWTQDFGAGN